MKSKDVLKLLQVTRVTLMSYNKSGKIKGIKMKNGLYNYDEQSVFAILLRIPTAPEKSVFAFLKKDMRKNVIYCRVSTQKQKKYLSTQSSLLINYCVSNNIIYDNIYTEICSGTNLDRSQLSLLIDDVINYKIKTIYITHKDRLTRLSFKTLEQLFGKFGTSIVSIFDSPKDYESELFDDLLNILHHFSTKIYSKRNKDKFKILKKKVILLKEP